MLRPRSVAVTGASRRSGTIGGGIFHNLITAEIPGSRPPGRPQRELRPGGPMLEGIQNMELLDGFRGRPAAERPALVGAILRVSQFVGELPEVVELDLNPLVSPGPGRGVVVVDARIRVRR